MAIPKDTEAAELARALLYSTGGLASVADLARRWNISRSRAHELASRPDFPAPVDRVSDGTVALYSVIEADAWRGKTRRPGRPRKEIISDDAGQTATMTRYVVVTRDKRLPVDRFMTIEAAANYIVREQNFHKWTVLAQEANRITAGTPYRELTDHEKRQLEKALYPTLFE